jgi:hypothetical protein
MPRSKGLFVAALLGASLGGFGFAQAQAPAAPGQAQPRQDMPHSMPMQGGMMQGQGETAQGGCPMMQRSAAMERRLRQLEERLGVPAPAPAMPRIPG